MDRRSIVLMVCVGMTACFFAACGSSSGNDTDAGSLCGNGVMDPGEQCDDGNTSSDDDCTSTCMLACGDGIVQSTEACDTAIADGMPGACPTSCDDTDPCTTDRIVGADCQQQCENATVTDFVDGDNCCPDVADNYAFNDLDCAPVCGNGIVEMGETCDTAIATGEIGACPSACDDGEPCTVDSLVVPTDNLPGDGACRAYCDYTENTTVQDGDGCCPAGATYTTDDDCVGDRAGGTTTCGNGVRNGGQGELCDTAIAAGSPGACPTSCDNADPCVNSLLVSAGTCRAKCYEWDVAFPQNDDMCCPLFYGGNNRNDNDCTSSCGTPAQECDTPGEGTCDADCRIVRVAFRATSISIMDPHIYWDLGTGACADLTSVVNTSTIPDAMRQDTDGDGRADLVWINMFKPLDQSAATNDYELLFGNCAPGDPTTATCEADPLTNRLVSTATNQTTGTCLDVLANTTTGGYDPPDVPTGPCFVSEAFNTDVALGDLVVPMQDGYVAASYVGDPSDGLMHGLVRGFVSETAAMGAILPDTVPLLGGLSLYEILAGGITPGSCTLGGGPATIGDDRDIGPDGVTPGWYFYVNFTAQQVPFVDKPNASQ